MVGCLQHGMWIRTAAQTALFCFVATCFLNFRDSTASFFFFFFPCSLITKIVLIIIDSELNWTVPWVKLIYISLNLLVL